MFHDIDGSVGGVPDSYIVIDNGIADDPQHCQIKPDWNAAVCKGDMGRMQIGAAGGGGRGGGAGGRGGAAGPGAAGGRGGPGAAVAVLALPAVLAVLPQLAVLAQLEVLALLEVVAELAVEVPLLHRSFSAAMVRKFTVSGDTTVLAGTEIRAESEAPSLNISVRELDNGSWVIVELPGYTTAATGTAQTSMDALRSASSTSYYQRRRHTLGKACL